MNCSRFYSRLLKIIKGVQPVVSMSKLVADFKGFRIFLRLCSSKERVVFRRLASKVEEVGGYW